MPPTPTAALTTAIKDLTNSINDFDILGIGIQAGIGTLVKRADDLQRSNLSVGMSLDSFQASNRFLQDLPGGLTTALEGQMQFIQEGLRDAGIGLNAVAVQSKLTGGSQKQVIASLAEVVTQGQIQAGHADSLGMEIVGLSQRFHTTGDAIVNSIQGLTRELKAAALLGGDTAQLAKVFAQANALVGPDVEKNLRSFVGEIMDPTVAGLQKANVLGLGPLREQLQQGNIQVGDLLRGVLKADQRITQLTANNQVALTTFAGILSEGLLLDTKPLAKDIDKSLQKQGIALATLGGFNVAADLDQLNNSLMAQTDEIVDPMQQIANMGLPELTNVVKDLKLPLQVIAGVLGVKGILGAVSFLKGLPLVTPLLSGIGTAIGFLATELLIPLAAGAAAVAGVLVLVDGIATDFKFTKQLWSKIEDWIVNNKSLEQFAVKWMFPIAKTLANMVVSLKDINLFGIRMPREAVVFAQESIKVMDKAIEEQRKGTDKIVTELRAQTKPDRMTQFMNMTNQALERSMRSVLGFTHERGATEEGADRRTDRLLEALDNLNENLKIRKLGPGLGTAR